MIFTAGLVSSQLYTELRGVHVQPSLLKADSGPTPKIVSGLSKLGSAWTTLCSFRDLEDPASQLLLDDAAVVAMFRPCGQQLLIGELESRHAGLGCHFWTQPYRNRNISRTLGPAATTRQAAIRPSRQLPPQSLCSTFAQLGFSRRSVAATEMSVKVNEWASNGTTFEYGSAANPVSGPRKPCVYTCCLFSTITRHSPIACKLLSCVLCGMAALHLISFSSELRCRTNTLFPLTSSLVLSTLQDPPWSSLWTSAMTMVPFPAHTLQLSPCHFSLQLASASMRKHAGQAACIACWSERIKHVSCQAAHIDAYTISMHRDAKLFCRSTHVHLTMILCAELPYPATSPNLLGNYVRIVNGERIETVANATSHMFYCIRYASCRAPYHMYRVASSAGAGLL